MGSSGNQDALYQRSDTPSSRLRGAETTVHERNIGGPTTRGQEDRDGQEGLRRTERVGRRKEAWNNPEDPGDRPEKPVWGEPRSRHSDSRPGEPVQGGTQLQSAAGDAGFIPKILEGNKLWGQSGKRGARGKPQKEQGKSSGEIKGAAEDEDTPKHGC